VFLVASLVVSQSQTHTAVIDQLIGCLVNDFMIATSFSRYPSFWLHFCWLIASYTKRIFELYAAEFRKSDHNWIRWSILRFRLEAAN
jgi:hypothetical protein